MAESSSSSEAVSQETSYYTNPISVSDATSILKRNPGKNERPYIVATTLCNNRKVDAWSRDVLSKIADRRQSVPAGRVWGSWRLYDEGTQIKKYVELKEKNLFRTIPDEVLEFWKDFFEHLTVEEMHEYGAGTVAAGWGIIQDYIKEYFSQKKWDVLFSQAPEDPLFWEKNYHKHTAYIDGKSLPFWNEEILNDVQQKVAVVLGNQPRPQEQTGMQFK